MTSREPSEAMIEAINFLLGKGPLEGRWFGNKFWWRKHLREAIAAMQSAHISTPTEERVRRECEDALDCGQLVTLDPRDILASLKPPKDRETDREALLRIAERNWHMDDAALLKRIAEGMR